MRLRGQKKKKRNKYAQVPAFQFRQQNEQSNQRKKYFFFLKQGQHFTMLIAIKKKIRTDD